MPLVRELVVDVLRRFGWQIDLPGPLLIDRGRGLLYDTERDITWLQDANYARTVGRSADGQLTWYDAMAWVKGLRYRGITGWRLPDAHNSDGSGPCNGENCNDSEIGHLIFFATKRKSPPDLSIKNFAPYSVYWFSTEASATEAWAFKMSTLRQGTLEKDPGTRELPVPLDPVLAWPVHDGDVGASLLSRLVQAALDFFRATRRAQ